MTSPLFAILKKDFKAFFTSPMFYTLIGLCTSLWGLFFVVQVYSFSNQSYQLSLKSAQAGLNIHHDLVSSFLVVVHYVLIFIIAAMSMRFFAEEKKLKTFPVLLTAPLTSWQIVLAKWLVGAVTLFTLLLLSMLFPLSLLIFISLPLDLLFFSYLGLFLVTCVYMSASLVASAMTESLIVCVVLSLVFSVAFLLLGVGAQLTGTPSLQEMFRFLAFDQHFTNFRNGLFSLSSMFYFLSWSFILGLICERIVEFHRWR
jgi:ABC-2 type transport system permease protein